MYFLLGKSKLVHVEYSSLSMLAGLYGIQSRQMLNKTCTVNTLGRCTPSCSKKEHSYSRSPFRSKLFQSYLCMIVLFVGDLVYLMNIQEERQGLSWTEEEEEEGVVAFVLEPL